MKSRITSDQLFLLATLARLHEEKGSLYWFGPTLEWPAVTVSATTFTRPHSTGPRLSQMRGLVMRNLAEEVSPQRYVITERGRTVFYAECARLEKIVDATSGGR